MTNLIAITGKKGCGKSTASKHLELSHGFKRISFADPLKCMLLSLGLSSEELWGEAKEVPSELLGGQTPRHAMQTLGTEWGRNLVHKDIWILAWKIQVAKCSTPVVVDDLRFLNEAKIVKELGGKIILIERAETTTRGMHISEVELEKIPYDMKIVSKLLRTQEGDLVEKYKEILDLPAKEWKPKYQKDKAHNRLSKLSYGG